MEVAPVRRGTHGFLVANPHRSKGETSALFRLRRQVSEPAGNTSQHRLRARDAQRHWCNRYAALETNGERRATPVQARALATRVRAGSVGVVPGRRPG